MSREVEEKTVLRFAAMPADESRERIIKGIIVFCVLHHLHVEAVGLKGSSDHLDILIGLPEAWAIHLCSRSPQ